jgi:hypothetical protein
VKKSELEELASEAIIIAEKASSVGGRVPNYNIIAGVAAAIIVGAAHNDQYREALLENSNLTP